MFKLVIGNRCYSTWSLRAWLGLRLAGVPFDLEVLGMKTPEGRARMAKVSPTGSVPVLLTEAGPIWDLLAIMELAADLAPQSCLWPADPLQRAVARSMAAEMHNGFRSLRWNMPMDLRRKPSPKQFEPDVQELIDKDIARMTALWRSALARQPARTFLFGEFGLVDACYAPVLERIHSHSVPVPDDIAEYMEVVRAHPLIGEWRAAALMEPWVHDH